MAVRMKARYKENYYNILKKPAYAVITIHCVTFHFGMLVRGNPLTPKALQESPMSDKEDKQVRNRYVQIRLTDEEFSQLKKRAGNLGTSTFLRQLGLGEQVTPPKVKARKIIHAADPELVRHVAWIGNNINQIARHLNAGGQLDNDVLLALISIQSELETQISRTLANDC